MHRFTRYSLTGWFLSTALPAWAKTDPGIQPDAFALVVGAALLGGAAAGYYLGSQSDPDEGSGQGSNNGS